MKCRKPRAIGVDGEDRAMAPSAAMSCCAIQGVARQNQSAIRKSSVAVGCIEPENIGGCRETMQVRKTRAISVDGEHRAPAPARTAAISRRPIKGVAVARYS